MIQVLAAACLIFLSFWRLMTVCLSHDLEWDVSPVALLFLTVIGIRRRWLT